MLCSFENQSQNFEDSIYQIHCQDGLSELVCWKDPFRQSKTIEMVSTMLPVNHALRD